MSEVTKRKNAPQPSTAEGHAANQQRYHDLYQQVKQLKLDKIALEEKLNTLMGLYLKKVPTLRQQIAMVQLQIVKQLHQATFQHSFNKHQLQAIIEKINQQLKQVLPYVETTEEVRMIFNLNNDITFEEALRKTKKDFLDKTAAYFFEQYQQALNIGALSVHLDDESFADFQQKVWQWVRLQKQQFEAQQTSLTDAKSKAKHESRPADQPALRPLYLSLAKVLHPDKTRSIVPAEQREQMMKQATAAYANKDIDSLLELEQRYIGAADTLNESQQDKFTQYCALLEAQIETLKNDLQSLPSAPRFYAVADCAYPSLKNGKKKIKELIKWYEQHVFLLQLQATALQEKAQVLAYVAS